MISHGSYERLAIALNLVEDWGSATRHNTTICWMGDIQAYFLRLPQAHGPRPSLQQTDDHAFGR